MTHIFSYRSSAITAAILGTVVIALTGPSVLLNAEIIFTKADKAESGLTAIAGNDTIFFCSTQTALPAKFPLLGDSLKNNTTVHFSVSEYNAKASAQDVKKYTPGAPDNSLLEFERGKLYVVHTDKDLFFKCGAGLSMPGSTDAQASVKVPAASCPAVQCAFQTVPQGCKTVMTYQPNGCPGCGQVVCPAETVTTTTTTTTNANTATSCPQLNCPTPNPQPGCSYVFDTDSNGCPKCGSMLCAKPAAPAEQQIAHPSANMPASNPLEFTLESPAGQIGNGAVVMMHFSVKNNGDQALSDVLFSLTMPEGYKLPVGTVPANCTGNNNALSCSDVLLNPHQTKEFLFPFVATSDAACGFQQTRVIGTGKMQDGGALSYIYKNLLGQVQSTVSLPQTYSNFAGWTFQCDTTSTPASSAASSAFSVITNPQPSSASSSSALPPASSSSAASVATGMPLSVTLSGPTGLQKNTTATYTLVLKNTTASTTLSGLSFTFPFPTGVTSNAVSTMSNCVITAASMSCSGLVIQPQLSMTLSLPVQTLSTLPCADIPFRAIANVSGLAIQSNTITVKGCSGGTTQQPLTLITSIATTNGYLPKNTTPVMLTTVAAFDEPFTDGTLRIDLPTGVIPQTVTNSLNVGTCTTTATALICTGMSRDANKGAGYQLPIYISDGVTCGANTYTATLTYKDQNGIQKQLVKNQGMQLCSAATQPTGPLNQFTITTGAGVCASADCRTINIPVTLHNKAPITATNVLIAATLDRSWRSGTLNGAACQNVDTPTDRMIDCPGGPYLTIPAKTSTTYILQLSTDAACPIASPRTAVLLQAAPASIYEEDYSDNSVYATIPAACSQGPVSSSSSSSATPIGSSSSAIPQPTSSVSSVQADSFTLRSIDVSGDFVTIDYEKRSATCAHLITSQYQVVGQNLCDEKAVKIVKIAEMGPLFSVGQSLKLCHGNNVYLCSNPVTVTETPSTYTENPNPVHMRFQQPGESGATCTTADCRTILVPVRFVNSTASDAVGVKVGAAVGSMWKTMTLKGQTCTQKTSGSVDQAIFECPGLTIPKNSTAYQVGMILTSNAPCPVSNLNSINAALVGTWGDAAAYPTDVSTTIPLPVCTGTTSSASSAGGTRPIADVSIEVTGTLSATAGTSVIYTMTLRNTGTAAASPHVLNEIAQGLTFSPVISDTRCKLATDFTPPRFACDFTTINPGQSIPVRIGFLISPTISCPSTVAQNLTVFTPDDETNFQNNVTKISSNIVCASSASSVPYKTPVCGNGIVEAFEICDDGNKIETDSCKNNCTINWNPQTCGNGIREGTEACDDGNKNDADACSTKCTLLDYNPPPVSLENITVHTERNTWGGGTLYISGEIKGVTNKETQRVILTFADANGANSAAADSGPTFSVNTNINYRKTYIPVIQVTERVNIYKTVIVGQKTLDPVKLDPPTPVFPENDRYKMFVTNQSVSGNFKIADPAKPGFYLTGWKAADLLCNMSAWDAGLSPEGSTIWHSTISNPRRLTFPLYNMKNELLAQTENDLWSLQRGALGAKITSALGIDIYGKAWTGSDGTGKVATENCSGWSTSNPPARGSVGTINGFGGEWYQSAVQNCSEYAYLYCVNDITQ